MKQYSFLLEVFDVQTTKMRVSNIAKQPFRSAKTGALIGGAVGALSGSRKGIGGVIKGAMIGGGSGAAIGGIWGATGGQIKNITNSRKQIVDRDNKIQQRILKNPLASNHAKNVANAKMVKNNLINKNLQDYKNAIAQAPDAGDRALIKQQYGQTNKWIGDIHQANMYTT